MRSIHSVAFTAVLALASATCVPAPARAAAPPSLPIADAQLDAGSLHVQRFGHGDPVVLLPGLTTGPWEFADLIRRLSPRYTLYAVGLPGFDGRPAATPPLFDRVERDFWTFLDAQRIARPALIGHSLGGTLAIALGEQHPERLRGIVAIDGLPIFPGLERITAEQRLSAANDTFAQVTSQSHDQMVAYETQYMRTPGGVIDPALAASLAELEANSVPAAVAEWLKEDLTTDLRPQLARVSVPLLEIAPYNAPDVTSLADPYTEDQKATYYRALLSGAPRVQVVTVSPARHFAMFDAPDRVFAVVDAFLAQNR